MINRKYVILGSSIGIAGLILSYTYRPYIYENHIYDFHIADTIGSIVCVPAATLFFYGFNRSYSFAKLILAFTLTYILYELLGLFSIHGTFDYYDIIATIMSGMCTYFILSICLKMK